jgi:hypothetical protein
MDRKSLVKRMMKKIVEATYLLDYPDQLEKWIKHDYQHNAISMEGQEDPIWHRGSYSIDGAGSVQMIENMTS